MQLRWGQRRILVELGSFGALTAGIGFAFVASIYLATACYFIFRDDLVARLLSSQAETQYAYEDRIAALRAHLDRVATRQLINQDSFEDKVNDLISRQSQLETRQAIVNTIMSEAQSQAVLPVNARPGTANAVPAARKPVTSASATVPGVPTPLPAGDPAEASETRKTSLFFTAPELRLGEGRVAALVSPGVLDEVAAGLDRIQRNQILALNGLESRAEKRLVKYNALIAEVGLDRGRFQKASRNADEAVGGPLVALPKTAGPHTPFDRSVSRLQSTLGQMAHLSGAVGVLPINRPIAGDLTVTSGFGARPDPFLHGAAMHTGLDLRASWGSPVLATAPGRVISAGNQGGYGNMVEIDHGYGLTTRYAHLSSIDVEVGDTVEKGEVVGQIGSTGRSTGPHLHYETRIDGDPVDPMRFLSALERVRAL